MLSGLALHQYAEGYQVRGKMWFCMNRESFCSLGNRPVAHVVLWVCAGTEAVGNRSCLLYNLCLEWKRSTAKRHRWSGNRQKSRLQFLFVSSRSNKWAALLPISQLCGCSMITKRNAFVWNFKTLLAHRALDVFYAPCVFQLSASVYP